MRRAMLSVLAVNKSASVKQCVISSAYNKPIFSATDKQSDRDIFDPRRDEQQIVCLNPSPLVSLSVTASDGPLLDILLLCVVK